MITGITRSYRSSVRPAIRTIGMQKDVNVVAGMYILNTKRGPLFLADTTVNLNPSAEQIAEITVNVAKMVRRLKMTPRIALLSYSNFGSSPGPDPEKMAKAAEIRATKNDGTPNPKKKQMKLFQWKSEKKH